MYWWMSALSWSTQTRKYSGNIYNLILRPKSGHAPPVWSSQLRSRTDFLEIKSNSRGKIVCEIREFGYRVRRAVTVLPTVGKKERGREKSSKKNLPTEEKKEGKGKTWLQRSSFSTDLIVSILSFFFNRNLSTKGKQETITRNLPFLSNPSLLPS